MVKMIPEFREALVRYMNVRGLSKATKQRYLKPYKNLEDEKGIISQEAIDEFLYQHPQPPIRSMLKLLISAIKRGGFSEDIVNEISKLEVPRISGKIKKKAPRVMKLSDLNKMIEQVDTGDEFRNERLRCMWLLQFYAGLRLQELMGLTLEDFKPREFDKNKAYQELRIKSESAKFGIERTAWIPTEVYTRVFQWLAWTRSKNLAIKNNVWGLEKTRYKQELNKYSLKILGTMMNSHSLRHGRGYLLTIGEKRDISFVKAYLGHASISSTQRYTHYGSDQVSEELSKENPFIEEQQAYDYKELDKEEVTEGSID